MSDVPAAVPKPSASRWAAEVSRTFAGTWRSPDLRCDSFSIGGRRTLVVTRVDGEKPTDEQVIAVCGDFGFAAWYRDDQVLHPHAARMIECMPPSNPDDVPMQVVE